MRIRLGMIAFLSLLVSTLVLSASQSLLAQGGTGYLKTKVNPGRAGVFVDGKYVGPAANFGFARKYALPAGEHEITLSEARYQDYSTKVTIESGKTTTLSHSLQAAPLATPPFGRLRTVGADHFAAVFVNGKYMGHVDEFDNFTERLLLPPGDYTVKIVPSAGGQAYEEKVKVEANRTTVVQAK